MSDDTEKGIIVLNEPLIVNQYDFLYRHLDCDSIIGDNEDPNDPVVKVLAYAESEKYNDRLEEFFFEKGYDKKYWILQGIDSKEVNCID